MVIHLLLLCFTLVTLAALMANRFNAPKNFYLLIIFVRPHPFEIVVPSLLLLCSCNCYCCSTSHSVLLCCCDQTVFESLLLGSMVTYYDTDLVIKALGITAVVFVVLTLYTMQSKYDFSTWGAR